MYKRVTKQCNNDVKKRFNCIAKGRKKTNRDIIKQAKKMGEWEAWNKGMGEEKKIQKQIKKRMGHKTSKKINKIQI